MSIELRYGRLGSHWDNAFVWGPFHRRKADIINYAAESSIVSQVLKDGSKIRIPHVEWLWTRIMACESPSMHGNVGVLLGLASGEAG